MHQPPPESSPRTERHRALRIARALEELIRSRGAPGACTDEELLAAHPDLLPELAEHVRALRRVERAAVEARQDGDEADTRRGSERPISGERALPRFPGYEIREELHRGGQGVVYRATQTSTGRDVAVKVMRAGPFFGPRDEARFQREIRILARLNHPHIVTIHDSGIVAGHHYFAMTYINGRPLDRHCADRALTVRAIVSLFSRVCEAVDAAHLRGVIHRDLKPSNILVDDSGEPHVLDFGLAKLADDEGSDSTQDPAVTLTGQFLGSLPWASPEAAQGDTIRSDLRTDVYSLGVVLFQALTGAFPYCVTGNMRDVLERISESTPIRPGALRKELDGDLDAIVLKCLAKERERRYQSAGELARDLNRYLASELVSAKRDSAWYVLRKQFVRHRLPVAVAAAFVLTLLASSVVAWTLYAESRQRLRESYVTAARATRNTTLPGRKLEALALLQRAGAIRRTRDLRDEAAAALALADVSLGVERAGRQGEVGAFSPQLTRVALFHLESGKCSVFDWGVDHPRIELSGARGQRMLPCFSPDDRFLALCEHGECRIWNIDRGEVASSFPLSLASYTHGDFREDGKVFAAGDADGCVQIHDLQTLETRAVPVSSRRIAGVRFNPDGDMLAVSAYAQGEVCLVDVASERVARVLSHPDEVLGLAWSPEGDMVACGCNDSRVYLWDAHSGTLRRALSGHSAMPVRLGFSAGGGVLWSYAWDGTARFWDPHLGTHLLTLDREVMQTGRGADQFGYQWSGDAYRFGIGRLLESEVFLTLYASDMQPQQGCFSIAVRGDGRIAASGGFRHIRVWDLTEGRALATIDANEVSTVLFSPTDDHLLSSSLNFGIQRWPLLRQGDELVVGSPAPLLPPGWVSMDAELSADGTTLALAANRSEVAILDLSDPGALPRVLGPHPGVRGVTISRDGRWVASTGDHQGPDGMVRVWDARRGALLEHIAIPTWQDARFSPDNRWLVIATLSGHRIYDTASWRLCHEFSSPYNGPPGSIAFSPTGDVCALVVDDRTIALVDVATWSVLVELESPEQFGVEALAFNSNGSRLFVPNAQGVALHVWDLRALRNRLGMLDLDWNLPPYP